ncbi:glycosyl hydrolase family 17 [Polaribacter reichenbachii]|uniref:Endo-1,3-beta-glucanase btgC n=1 Tax=Polaribacter reichenbachii TaxID=996801 RepID=A0A1B8U726_9FLAO|nr:glycosyl hydrolase family 17 protein [Polaribacter reichenbachii]APZ46227.1 glycosyl hydrolase family 17 [Polaribacter reichenbachii]AUC20089.1 glycosyl hydrolase family 17 [Polaribacter reichenbachii]OBY67652.1 glycosyl hydrolase family 17 [Polaribacter reichenbachii]
MKNTWFTYLVCGFLLIGFSCKKGNKITGKEEIKKNMTAAQILGNPDYLAISYGGYRERSRENQPTIAQLKEDLKLMFAMGIRIIRTYNVQPKLPHAANVLEAIHQLKQEDSSFEMYVMLGAWIDCLNAWTDLEPNHEVESAQNEGEIARAVALANKYPDIVKVIAVGNEAMIRWATSYFVQPKVILKYVKHLQNLKKEGKLSKDLWITCSDDFASWGGGDLSYRVADLENLIKAVDYVSMHTYAYHNSHYNPSFWKVPENEQHLSEKEKIDKAMLRALEFAKTQYKNVSDYVKSIDATKTIHIGETGWATVSNGHYGVDGSRATDEYKQGLYYSYLRKWTNKESISCFYFEAFDEQWKDAQNPQGSENHFGLFTLKGEAKYPIWNLVDQGIFKDLHRGGNPIIKTFNGDKEKLMKTVLVPNTDYQR